MQYISLVLAKVGSF